MRLTPEEMDLFHAACADQRNRAAQDLMNVFAVEQPIEVLLQLPTVPLGILAELVTNLWNAINAEHRRRTGCDLIVVDDAVA
jgi:hypothetical protein